MEEWKDIQGYEGLYQVSNEGRVKSLKFGKEKILKGRISSNYLLVCLRKNGKSRNKLIHRLVAEAFLENPQNLQEVNHKDENKTNNHVENLEWCTPKYNSNYGTGHQRSSEKQINDPTKSKRVDQIDPISGEVVRKWESVKECCRNGYNNSCIWQCCIGKRKIHKGYVWKYLQA